MVHFVGAGPGAPDLITLRGAALLEAADQVIYAGSLVNPALLERCRADCRILNSAVMTLEEVIDAIRTAECDPGRIKLLRGGCGAPRGIHPAGDQPDADPDPDGREDAGAGTRTDPRACPARKLHGDLPLRGDAARAADGTDEGRLYGGDSGGAGI